MARLRALPPRLGPPLPSRIAAAPDAMGTGFVRTDGRSAAARGYDGAWRRLRLRILADEPLCRFCCAEGRVTPATDVDHITPFRGLDDPRRLDPANLRPLCRLHHLQRTARQSHGQE